MHSTSEIAMGLGSRMKRRKAEYPVFRGTMMSWAVWYNRSGGLSSTGPGKPVNRNSSAVGGASLSSSSMPGLGDLVELP